MLTFTKQLRRELEVMERETPPSIELLQHWKPILWLAAVAFFGVGDVLTTSIGLEVSGVREAGPVTGALIETYGLPSMVAAKTGIICGCYALWAFAPRPSRVGIPLGLAVLGIAVVWWNLLVIALATQL